MTQWYVAVNGQQYGPVDKEVLGQWVRQGRVSSSSYVWTEGMQDWLPLSQVSDLADRLGVGRQPPLLPRRSHRGALVLVLGLAGTVCCCLGPLAIIPGVIAVVLAIQDLRAMDRGEMDPAGHGLVIAGLIFGIISILLGLSATIGHIFYPPMHYFRWHGRRF